MKMLSILRKCSCLRKEPEDVKILDLKHSGLHDVPNEIFNFERTLEELYLDFNQIQDLPRPLFYCHELRKLGLSDNEIHSLPSAIASLINLEVLDICKNAILDIPDNIKLCKCLRTLEASVNPLGKLPEGFTQLINLEELYLNDTFVDFLPANFGRLFKLKILELRENHLKSLPKSMARLSELSRLDIGQNDFRDLPEVIGNLQRLSELWCDCNRISHIPAFIGNLKYLRYIDASKNRIESIPCDIEHCINLTDITLSSNNLKLLPESIGCLTNLQILRLDDNRLQKLPNSIGSMINMEELVLSQNNLQHVPPGIGLLRKLHTLILDENILEELPPENKWLYCTRFYFYSKRKVLQLKCLKKVALEPSTSEVGSCVNLTILSIRCNRLVVVPDEIGHNSQLKIINCSENRIRFLPYSLKKLKDLQALWLSENQNKPLIPLQGDIDIDTGQRVLTCYLLPQVLGSSHDDCPSDGDSFQLSVWEEQRPQRQHIKFAYDEKLDKPGKLVRNPTPYPKELKSHVKHARNQALKSKGGANYVNINALTAEGEEKPEAVVAEASVSQLSDTISVKEAKVTKPILSSNSFDAHDTWPLHDVAKDKLIKTKNNQSKSKLNSLPDKSTEVESDRSSDSKGLSTKSDVTARPGNLNNSSTHLDNKILTTSSHPAGSSSNAVSVCEQLSQSRTQISPSSEINMPSGYRSDHEVYENIRQESLNTMAQMERNNRLNRTVSDGYASDVEPAHSLYMNKLMTPMCSPNKLGKAASVSTAVAKKLFNDGSFNKPSLFNAHNYYFVHENQVTRKNERPDVDFNKTQNVYRLSHGPPPDLLPRNTGQTVIDTSNSSTYSSGLHSMYPTSLASVPHNPVPLPPRRRPSNLNLYPDTFLAQKMVHPTHMSPAMPAFYHQRPSPPSPYSLQGPPSPNRNRKPPPYHIATTYSKRAFISPPSPVLKPASLTFRPPSPLLLNSRLTPPPQSNLSFNSFRRSCHGSDPALATRSNTPPSPSANPNSNLARQRSHSSVNGAIVFDNPYVEELNGEKHSRHYDFVPVSPTKGSWSPQNSKQRFSPSFGPSEGRRGSLSAPSTPPHSFNFTDNNSNISSAAMLPAYRTPPLYQTGSAGSLTGSAADINESSKYVSHKRNAANGYHISGPRWPPTSSEVAKIELQEPQCGIFTALPVLVKSCSGADMQVEPTTSENRNESSGGSTIYANMYASTTGRIT